MIVLGIDPGKRCTGWAVVDSLGLKLLDHGELKLKWRSGPDYVKMAEEILGRARSLGVTHVAVEDQYLGVKFDKTGAQRLLVTTYKSLTESRMVWTTLAWSAGLKVVTEAPAAWQTAVLPIKLRAKSGERKCASIWAAKAMWNVNLREDVADAANIARWAVTDIKMAQLKGA